MRLPTSLRRFALVTLLGGLLAACAPPVLPPAPVVLPAAPAEFPAAYYRQVEARGGKVLRVDPRRSLLTVEVGRAGTLARLGHEHVVASHDLQGYVAPGEGRSDLYLPLALLAVDEPDLRDAAGFAPQPSPEAVAGTQRNMIERVLDAERFPFLLIGARRGENVQAPLQLAITLRGATRHFEIPVQIEQLAGDLIVSGQMSVKQSDFGIVPMAVLGGALQVRDRLDLHFRIVAAEY